MRKKDVIFLKKRKVNLPELIRNAKGEIKAITLMKIGIPVPIITEDRRILENVILPYFANNSHFTRILFVGTAKYTWHYGKIFAKKEYSTIEPLILNSIYGAKHHIVGYLDHIDRYFKKNSLDLIICNGVLGFGLNDPKEIESSFRKCHFCLRKGGVLLIGWNDIKERVLLPLDKIKSLQQFQPFVFPPLGESNYPTHTENRHIFSFYIKTG